MRQANNKMPMNSLAEDQDLYTPENERRTLSLMLLALFWKFRTIPSYAVSEFVDEKLLKLYCVDDVPQLGGYTFVRLTYKGRKIAKKSYNILRVPLGDETKWTPEDPYKLALVDEEYRFLMNHKRFRKELLKNGGFPLYNLYERRLNVLADLQSIPFNHL